MLLAALVLANPTVTLDIPADRLPAVLSALGSAMGQRLECAANLNREVVVIRIDNRPQDEVMTQFAAALDADWRAIDGGFRLVRSPERVKSLKEAQLQREAWAYAEWMEKVQVEEPFDADGLARKMRGVVQAYQPRQDPMIIRRANEEGPAHRALVRALHTIGSRGLAAIPVGGRVVYASRPTPAQRALNAQAILRQYGAEQKAWWDAAKKQGVRPPKVGGSTIIPSGLLSKLTPTEAPSRILIELSRHTQGPSVVAYLKLVDAQGRVMDKASVGPGRALVDIKAGKIPLATSADAKALGGFWGNAEGRRGISNDLRVRLSDPVKHEPLQIVAGDLLAKVAVRRTSSLIACLPDSVMMTGTFLPKGGSLTEEEYLDRLALDGLEVDQRESWLLGRITLPLLRETQVDRQILRDFARLPLGEGLEIAADWAARLPSTLDNPLPMAIRSFVQGESDPTFTNNEPRTLRFYGSLNREQRIAISEGLSLGSLTALQRERLQPLLGLIGSLDVEGPKLAEREDDSGEGDIRGEPTEALPNGIPRDGVLIGDRSRRDVVMAGWSNSGPDKLALSPREFVDQEMAGEMMRKQGRLGGLDLQALQSAEQEVLFLRFRLTESVSAQRRLSAIRNRGEPGGLGAMPVAFQQEVEKIRERWRKAQGVGTPPP